MLLQYAFRMDYTDWLHARAIYGIYNLLSPKSLSDFLTIRTLGNPLVNWMDYI